MEKFEDKIKKMLDLLVEQEPPEETPTPPTNVAQQQIQPQRVQQAQTQNIASDAQATKKIQYLATNVMYYMKPPVDSADWPQEKDKKVWLLPLMDGRIMNDLAKSMGKSFKLTADAHHGAARYRPFQFRIILHGTLTADTTFRIKTKEDDNNIRFSIDKFDVSTPHAGQIILKSGDTRLKNKKTSFKVTTDKEVVSALNDIKTLEAGAEEKFKHQADIVQIAQDKFEAKKGIATKFAKWLLDNYKITSDEQLARLTLKHFRDFEKGKFEELDLQKYLKAILVEIKKEKASHKYPKSEKGEELEIPEDETAIQLTKDINSTGVKALFKEKGITCNTSNRMFEGTVLEFFATNKANFEIVDITSSKNDEVLISGKLRMVGEAWFDARVGELNRKLDTWTFRVHDVPSKFFLQRRYGTIFRKLGTQQTKLKRVEK